MSRQRSHPGVGASSILLIIVVLSLTTFGVLTLVSARNDRTLTARAVETAAAYYAADKAAQTQLMEIDMALLSGRAPLEIPGLTALDGAQGAYTFRCETGDSRAVSVVVRIDPGEKRCAVVSYKLVQLSEWSSPTAFHLASPAQ